MKGEDPAQRPGLRKSDALDVVQVGFASLTLAIASSSHAEVDTVWMSSGVMSVADPPKPSGRIFEQLQAVSTSMSEEELLGLLEVAIEGTGGASLRPLDDLTPRVWEVAAR